MINSLRNNCITSECCKAFTVIVDGTYICTSCGLPCQNIEEGETVIVTNKFNLNGDHFMDETHNINLWHDARNWYNDPTLQLVNHKCVDCGSFCRFARDYNNNSMFICSNPKCRHVFNDKVRIDNAVNN